MNEIERVDVLKHLILDIPLDKQNIIELRSKAEVHLEHIRTALTELAEIKKRAEAHQYVLKLAIDFIDAHPEMLKQVILLKSANEKELEAVNYIIKGDSK